MWLERQYTQVSAPKQSTDTK